MIHYDSIHDVYVTVPTDDENLQGKTCYLLDNGKAHVSCEGGKIHGFCTQVRNGLATMQIHGVVTTKYSGRDPFCGLCALTGDTSGGVMVDGLGLEYVVLNVDKENKIVTFFM